MQAAVVGSGPSGFYASEALLRSGLEVRGDMFERLPAPYGLVRYGVAPDHPRLKEPILLYQTIARMPHFNLLGNVTVGRDASVEELRTHYHAVVFTCGAQTDRHLGVPGEHLAGGHAAFEFVAWYNGHPEYRDRGFDLSQEVVAIIGQGNVATDLCRILGKSVDELRTTDIAEHALEALAESRVREIHVIGRRGPAQAKFTNKELRELGELTHCDVSADPRELELNAASMAEIEGKANTVRAKNVEILREFASRRPTSKPRRLIFQGHFSCTDSTLISSSSVCKSAAYCTHLQSSALTEQSLLAETDSAVKPRRCSRNAVQHFLFRPPFPLSTGQQPFVRSGDRECRYVHGSMWLATG